MCANFGFAALASVEGNGAVSDRNGETYGSPRTLVGATVLQIVPALREEPVARTALIVAHALLQSGARALIAAEDGPLVAELKAFGGEWVPLVNATVNPFKLRSAARKLEQLIASNRVDIVHAQSIGGAWSANLAAAQVAVWLVATLPDVPATARLRGYWAHGLAPRRLGHHAFELRGGAHGGTLQDPARILLVPGRVAPWNGQLILPEVARALLDSGVRGFVFVLAGEHQSYRKYARIVAREAKAKDVGALIRLVGHCRDMPAALGAADTVVFPAIEPPMFGRAVAQAQALGRPVVTSDVGILPEQLAAPPELPEDVRTGWVVKSGDANAFAGALSAAFSLDDTAYRAMAARARQFAHYMFSPESVATATRAVYSALLAREM
jgi:glycosyltransferase involved in cell wall biosynthesis